MVDVSIIFVNYKTKDLTINAINSVIDKTKNIDYEIFVVDNASNDGSIEAIEEKFPKINIIKSQINGGFGYANNLAIKLAQGKYIFCLNTDTLLVNNAIKSMFDYMENHEHFNIGACGGDLIDSNGSPIPCGGNFPNITEIFWKFGLRNILKKQYLKYKLTLTSDNVNFTGDIDYILGADIFIRKSIIDEIGVFDEKFFMYYEETDLCKRIRNAGHKIKLVRDAQIIHLEGKSCTKSINSKKISKTSEIYYFKKYHHKQVWMIKVLYSVLFLVDWTILGHKDSKKLMETILND